MTGSAIYEGWVMHRRMEPVSHSFRYRVFMPLFDLDELPELLDPIPFWSARGPAPARFRSEDFLGEGSPGLAERARKVAGERVGRRPAGPVRLLANPRYLGVGFNPISLLFVHAEHGCKIDAAIAEVSNTPWGERTTYVLDGGGTAAGEPLTGSFEKAMHVSPFQPMEQRYEISVTPPADRLGVTIRNLEGDREVFVATMALRRRELTRARMVRLLLSYPPMTLTTLARIYWNAVRLAIRGAPYHPHPEVDSDEQAVRLPEPPRRRRGDRSAGSGPLRGHGETGGGHTRPATRTPSGQLYSDFVQQD